MMLKPKFTWNLAILDVPYSSLETVIVDPKEMLGTLHLRLVGYYKIKQEILEQNLGNYYMFELYDTLCEQFNKFINTLKIEREKLQEKYPWLEPDNERKNMSDSKILDKYVD